MKELDFLRKIKSVTFATAENNLPHARIIDVMMIEDDKIFFTTARGKSFYHQLMENPNVAVVGMDNNYVSIRISGQVKVVDRKYVDKIFVQNPVMNDIYPGEKRDILEALCIYKGVGEIFDLSQMPLKRNRFAFGGKEAIPCGYTINSDCIACGICEPACPEGAITQGDIYVIDGTMCVECGRCAQSCPSDAIDEAKLFE